MPNAAPPQESTPLVGRLLRLAVGIIIIWLIVFVLAPLPFQYSDTLRGLKEATDAYGIHPGSVYYTDVPTSGRAEANSREAVRAARDAREVPRTEKSPHSER